MIFALSVIAAIIPATIYAALIYWIDRYEKEPFWLLATVFLWGAIPSIVIAIIGSTILGLPIYFISETAAEFAGAVIIAPLVEEIVKGLIILGIFFFWRHEFDSYLDGIIYGALVGMGFAMVENVFYFMATYAEGGFEAWGINVFMRAIVFGLNHSLYTSMTGLGLAIARLNTNTLLRLTAPTVGLILSMILHAVHNFAAVMGILPLLFLNAWGGGFVLLIIIIWAILQESRWIRTYLQEEVELGTITAEQLRIASKASTRVGRRLRTLQQGGFASYRRTNQFYTMCSELAYKKHHYELFTNPKNQELTEELRLRLRELSPLVF
ncbi:MAG TPA: PrsW family intramembrane metalloprotease [Anaerolineae bacterium]|nr:PrsW family intramembrane metalloprotease [Anaerolineae bacterium]